MTHVRMLLAGCFAVALVSMAGAAAPSTQPGDVEKENAELRQRVAALEAQVRSLEDQVARMTRRGGLIIPPMPQPPALPRIPQAPRLPDRFDRAPQPQEPGRNWIPKQHDGRTFYIVPCTPANEAR